MPSKGNVNNIIAIATLIAAAWTAWKVDRGGRNIREEQAAQAYDLGLAAGRAERDE